MVTKQTPAVSPSAADLSESDAILNGEYHFLDVGEEKYGECILALFGDIRILIDGSHQGDAHKRGGHPSIPEQLAAILNESPPHRLTLLVVSHCHADHIGCLPELVSNNVIRPEWALVTDPNIGFGRSIGEEVLDAVEQPGNRLAAVLREEDVSDLSDEELRAFIDGVMSIESRYTSFLRNLQSRGTEVVLYQGRALPTALARVLAPTGATLLGPSEAQLLLCAQQIGKTNKDASDAAAELLAVDADLDIAAMYREVVKHDRLLDGASGNRRGNGMNCQSISFAFGPKSARALLAGDMQFVDPGVAEIDEEMAALLQVVVEQGPYKLFKTTHHSSHNGQDSEFLSAIGSPPFIVHCGGIKDPSHPFPVVLDMLEERRSQLKFARTDRNGHIAVSPHLPLTDAVQKTTGRLNDFSENSKDVEFEHRPAAPQVTLQPAHAEQPAITLPAPGGELPTAGPQIVIVNLPPGAFDLTVAGVDIVVRTPASFGSSTTPAIRLSSDRRQMISPTTVTLAAGRPLRKLLFATDSARLAENIGRSEASAALNVIRRAGHEICDVAGNIAECSAAVRRALRRAPDVAGTVLLGGYDVLPSNVVDTIGPKLRQQLGRRFAELDDDHFFVWSDEVYGDIDEDRVAEVPVSRVPDARNANLFLNALGTQGVGAPAGFGVRNVERPFADDVWQMFAGKQPINVSKDFLHSHVVSTALTTSGLHYFMLHGRWQDGRVFYGELGNQAGYTEAFSIKNVPEQVNAVAFSGCCWGALTVDQKASDIGATLVRPRVAESSIALTYLGAGASAFVGCTGAHYSGADTDPEVNYASLMHRQFWSSLCASNYSAAVALHEARNAYSVATARMPDMDPVDLARRLKNRQQFTCLGLGW